MLHSILRSEERASERPRRHLPDIPVGRRETVTIREPPVLPLYDDSSIVGAGSGQSIGDMQGIGSGGFRSGPVTSTPSAPVSQPVEQMGVSATKFHDKSSAKLNSATFDGTVHWTDYKAHFDACAELNGWKDKEKRTLLGCILKGSGTRSLWESVVEIQ